MPKDASERPLLLAYLVAAVGCGSYLAANVVFLTLIMPLYLAILPIRPVAQLFIRGMVRVYLVFLTRIHLPLLGVYRITEISGSHGVPKGTPVVYVANHRSRIDAPLLLGLLPRCATIIKSTYARLPVFSSFVKHVDFVGVDSASLSSIRNAMARCRRLLDKGLSVLVFPEGTRARSGRLQTFGDLAFRIAVEAGVPVAPIVVQSDYPFLARRPGSIFTRHLLHFRIRFLEIQVPGHNERPTDMAERVYRMMAVELAGMDKGTVWEGGR